MTFPRSHRGAVAELLGALDLVNCCQPRDCLAVRGRSSPRPAHVWELLLANQLQICLWAPSGPGWSVGIWCRRGSPIGIGPSYPPGQKQSRSSIRHLACVPN